MDWNEYHAETEETPEQYARGEARSEAGRKGKIHALTVCLNNKPHEKIFIEDEDGNLTDPLFTNQ